MRHNKKRNSALLYEFLIRHISKCLVEGKKAEAQKAVALSKRYFSEGTALRGELSLFSAILNNRVKSKESAQRVLNATYEVASKMNARVLDEQKSKLIKEINYTFQEESFYDAKIPNYTVYASLQTLLNEARNKKKTLGIVDKVKIEESVADYLTREKKVAEDPLKINPNYSNTVYGFLMQRFHKKYEGKLNESQKKLLTQYSLHLMSNKPDSLKQFVLSESKKIRTSLQNLQDESLKSDKDLSNKLLECRKKFESFSLDEITEQKILEMLQYMKLVEEVES